MPDLKKNISDIKRIIKNNDILERITEHFPSRDLDKEREKLITYLVENCLEIIGLMDASSQ